MKPIWLHAELTYSVLLRNAALVLRALTAKDALARLKRHPVRPLRDER